MSILNLIASNNYIPVNKALVNLIGLEEAIILGELASEYNYWNENNGLDEEGYFYSTIDNIEKNTTLSVYKQRKVINNLIELGLISVKIKDLPAKRFIKINENQVLEILNIQFVKNSTSSLLKTNKLDSEKLSINKNIYNKNKEIKIKLNIKEKEYIEKEIVEYLNFKTGSNYKYSSEKTKSLIRARINEGFTIDDFKTVIDKKCVDWLNDNQMNKFLRPETLFGTKFESYLNQKQKNITTKDFNIDFSNF